MNNPSTEFQTVNDDSVKAEADRIQTVYRKRSLSHHYSWFDPSYAFMIQQRNQVLLKLLDQHAVSKHFNDFNLLDIGCGTGAWLRTFIEWGLRPENAFGIELLQERVDVAKCLCPTQVNIQQGNARNLPFADQTFDMVLQATVFTSILDENIQLEIAKEMLRIMKPGGVILWYDFFRNNPRNPNVRGVTKNRIHSLFPHQQISLTRTTLAPPITRFVVPKTWLGGVFLETMPFLRTHYLGIIRNIT
ncbi:MAG: class I SAM-dependent methyltransferase [Pirellulales bacterium]